MGCQLSHSGDGDHQKDEMVVDPPPPQPSDPRLPLNPRQKFNIIKSWKGISRAIEPTGVYMFVKLFEENRDIISLFDKFKELKTRDAQAESLQLAEHATVVMNSIDEGIKAMDNIDFFFDLLYQIGASHRKIPGFQKEYFWKIERPFLESVRLTLGDRYTDNMDQIYRITIKFIIETVVRGYEMAQEKELNDNVRKNGTSDSYSISATNVPTTFEGAATSGQAGGGGTCPNFSNCKASAT